MLHGRNMHVYIILLNTSTVTKNVKHLQYIGHILLLHTTVSRYEYFRAFADKTKMNPNFHWDTY